MVHLERRMNEKEGKQLWICRLLPSLYQSLKDECRINIPCSLIIVTYMKAWEFLRGLEVEREKITILTLFKHTFHSQRKYL